MFEKLQPMPFEAQAHEVQLTLKWWLHLLIHFVTRLKANYALGFDRDKLLNLGQGEIAS